MPDKERELVDRLLARTTDGTIHWEPTAKEGEYVTAFGGNIVASICRSSWAGLSGAQRGMMRGLTGVLGLPTQEPDWDHKLTVKHADKGEILTIWDEGSGISREELAQLYEEARRSSLELDATLDTILDALKPR